MKEFEFNFDKVAKTLGNLYTKKGADQQTCLNNISIFKVFLQQLEMLNKVIKLESQSQVLIKYIAIKFGNLSFFPIDDFIKILICTNFKINGINNGLWHTESRVFFEYSNLYEFDEKDYEDYAYAYWVRLNIHSNGFFSLHEDYKSFQLLNELHEYYKEGKKIDKVIKNSINFLNLKLKKHE